MTHDFFCPNCSSRSSSSVNQTVAQTVVTRATIAMMQTKRSSDNSSDTSLYRTGAGDSRLTFAELTASDVFQDGCVGQIQAAHSVTEDVTEVAESTVPGTGRGELFTGDYIEREVTQRSL